MLMGIFSALFSVLKHNFSEPVATDIELANWACEQYSLPEALRTPIRIDRR